MKSKGILNELRKEMDEIKQKPFSREEVVILSQNEKIAIDNKILSLEHENQKLKKVIEQVKELPNCKECDSNWHKGCMCLKKKIMEILENEK